MAIFTRLQEIVAMVQLSKKTIEDKQQQEAVKEAPTAKLSAMSNITSNNSRQLEEFHANLLHSSSSSANNKFNNKSSNSSNNSHRSSEKSAPQLEIGADGQLRVVNQDEFTTTTTTAVESSNIIHHSSGGKSRRMPHSRDFGGPPEKRIKLSSSSLTPERGGQQAASSSSSSGRRSSKGGKGIRNRVFCGDCPGCLKNDDCGQCRYCRYSCCQVFRIRIQNLDPGS